jgi:hypothetical protein
MGQFQQQQHCGMKNGAEGSVLGSSSGSSGGIFVTEVADIGQNPRVGLQIPLRGTQRGILNPAAHPKVSRLAEIAGQHVRSKIIRRFPARIRRGSALGRGERRRRCRAASSSTDSLFTLHGVSTFDSN